MHEQAHADQALEASPALIEHPLIPRGEATIITTQDQLVDLLSHLRESQSFAYDSEFIGELTYVPKLCLVQVATTKRVALIDPLANVDLAAFWQLICDPAVEKIVHAGDQDIEPVIRLGIGSPANVLDTQVLAAFAGWAYPTSLQKLVQGGLGIKLGKGLTFTHWDQRPLSAMQLRYAADDVRYLPALAEVLKEQVRAASNFGYAVEECGRRCASSFFHSDPNDQFRRIRAASNMSRTQLAILRELYIWRDATAQAQDIPPRALLRDEVLVALVRTNVKTEAELGRIRGMPRPVVARFANEILAALKRAAQLPPEQRPTGRHFEEEPADRFVIDALWAHIQCHFYDRKIDPAIGASRQQLADLYCRRKAGQNIADHPLLAGWRREIVGAELGI